MASKKITADELSASLEGILEEYGKFVNEGLQEAIKKAAQKGRAALKQSSPRAKAKPSGRNHYADNWAVIDTSTRLTVNDIIYNKTPTYRVAHLLENGHAKRNGGRVPARVHIKPVEEEVKKFAVDMFERYL